MFIHGRWKILKLSSNYYFVKKSKKLNTSRRKSPIMFIKTIIPVLALDRISVTFKDYVAIGKRERGENPYL